VKPLADQPGHVGFKEVARGMPDCLVEKKVDLSAEEIAARELVRLAKELSTPGQL